MTAPSLSLADIERLVGQETAVSPWYEVTQQQIDLFAEATGDKQWIHVDPERARGGPFGLTIAHGFLTLSMISELAGASLTFSDAKMAVNYGLNRVRFTAPVPSGSKVRAHFGLSKREEIERGVQITWNVTMEREGVEKPCLIAEWLVRYYQ